jgi:hypothetical protein
MALKKENINRLNKLMEGLGMDELSDMNNRVCDQMDAVQVREAYEFRSKFKRGDKVKWDSKKHGKVYQGVIEKFNPKRARIRTDQNIIWNVPYSMLESA